LRSSQARKRRIKIDRMHRHVTLAARLHFARLTHDQRDADAAFIGRAFAFAKRRVVRHAGESAVVASEDDERVLGEPKGVEFRQQAADFVVDMFQHGKVVRDGPFGGLAFIVRRPLEAASDMLRDQGLWCLQLCVRTEMSREGKPRPAAIRFDETNDVVRDGGDGFILVMLVTVCWACEVEAVGVKIAFTSPAPARPSPPPSASAQTTATSRSGL
jgi:hypothetical protein